MTSLVWLWSVRLTKPLGVGPLLLYKLMTSDSDGNATSCSFFTLRFQEGNLHLSVRVEI